MSKKKPNAAMVVLTAEPALTTNFVRDEDCMDYTFRSRELLYFMASIAHRLRFRILATAQKDLF
jgi:hypothetical protein